MNRLFFIAFVLVFLTIGCATPQQKLSFIVGGDIVEVIIQGDKVVGSTKIGSMTTLQKGTGKIKGTLVNKNSIPIQHLQLTPYLVKDSSIVGIKDTTIVNKIHLIWLGFDVSSNALGEFSFSDLPEGKYFIDQYLNGFSGGHLKTKDGSPFIVHVKEGEVVNLGNVLIESK
jgi:hypothetical protein